MKSFVLPLIALVLHLATGHAYSPQIARRATCGVKGYDRGSPQAYYYSTKPVELSEAGCGAVCAAESACNSFAIGSDACLLYTSSLVENFKQSSRSSFIFFAKACINNIPAPSQSVPRASSRPSTRLSSSPGSPSAPPSASNNCGVVGYDKGKPEAFYSSSKKSKANINSCGALCKSKKGCLSFAIGPRACLLYKSTVASNTEISAGSPYVFYDLQCAIQSSLTPSSAVSSTPASLPGSSSTPASESVSSPESLTSSDFSSKIPSSEGTSSTGFSFVTSSAVSSSATESSLTIPSSIVGSSTGLPSATSSSVSISATQSSLIISSSFTSSSIGLPSVTSSSASSSATESSLVIPSSVASSPRRTFSSVDTTTSSSIVSESTSTFSSTPISASTSSAVSTVPSSSPSSVPPPTPGFTLTYNGATTVGDIIINPDPSTNTTTITFRTTGPDNTASITIRIPGTLSGGSDTDGTQYTIQSFINLPNTSPPTTTKQKRQIAGCSYNIDVDTRTVLSIDLSAVTPGVPYPYTSAPFTPLAAGSTIKQRVSCPLGVTMPVLEAAGGVLVVHPLDYFDDAKICGLPSTVPGQYFIDSDNNQTNTHLQAPGWCASLCRSRPDCKSFITASSPVCRFFNETASKGFRFRERMNYILYDATCTDFATVQPSIDPTGSNCGIKGEYDSVRDTYFRDNTRTYGTLEKCSALCVAQNCQSFSYGLSYCYLWKNRVVDNLYPNDNVELYFYDASCIPGYTPRPIVSLVASTSTSARPIPTPPVSQAPEVGSSSTPAGRPIPTPPMSAPPDLGSGLPPLTPILIPIPPVTLASGNGGPSTPVADVLPPPATSAV